jgi:hypothetical protein
MKYGRVVQILIINISTAFFSLTLLAQQPTRPAAIATQASGGVFGSQLGELRCPINLSGIGPEWRGIRVGVSTLSDLQRLYSAYDLDFTLGTPFPSWATLTPSIPVDYAPNYTFNISGDMFQPQFKLPQYIQACVVNDKIAAFSIFTWDDFGAKYDDLPQTVDELISLLGIPSVISSHDANPESRLLHWHNLGISAEIEYGYQVIFTYYYPFIDEEDQDSWPMNALLKGVPFDGSLLSSEYIDIPSTLMALTAAPAWHTRTPDLYLTATSTSDP